jgi:hypothetical protein
MLGLFDYGYWYFKSRKKDCLIGDRSFKRHIITQEGKDIWVCFLPWRYDLKEAQKKHLLPKKGSLLVYEGPPSLAGIDAFQAKKSLENLTKDFSNYLNENNDIRNKINILGISIGTLPAFYIANHFNVKKLVAVCPGARLGENIYKGIATKEVMKISVKRHKTYRDYDGVLNGMNPIDNINNLPKEVYVVIGGRDKYILTESGEELITALNKAGKNPKVNRCKFLGHGLTLFDFSHKNKTGKLDYFN